MEIALRRLDGVDKVAISIEKQMFAVFYKDNASFQPKALRGAVAGADVSVVRFHISARGVVQEQNGQMIFIAGKDRFLLIEPPSIPKDTPIGVMGTVLNESTSPMQQDG